MSRTLIPLAIGGAGYSAYRWHIARWVVETVADRALVVLPRVLLDSSGGQLTGDLLATIYQLGGIWLAWELRAEICWALRAALRFLQWLLVAFGVVLSALACFIRWCRVAVGAPRVVVKEQLALAERDSNLTCMAVVAAPNPGGGVAQPFPVGSFILVSRPPNWDEIWIAGYLTNSSDVLGRTTVPDGSDWAWVVVRLVALAVKSSNAQPDGSRRAPAGVPGANVNWIYVPPDCNVAWDPDAIEVLNLSQEAQLILGQLQSSMAGVTVNVAGSGGDLVPLPAVGAAPLAPGGAGVVPGGGVAGLGPQGSGSAPTSEELKALEKAVQQLQAMAISSEEERKKGRKKDKEKDRKKSHKSDKKDRKRKKKKKKKRSSSTSSSSSSRSRRSRSRSGSTSSSSSRKPLAWKEKGKDKKVSYEDLTHVDQLRLKKKGDLLNFAAKHPGALTAHFLAGVYARLSKGTISRSSQLREASVCAWAHSHSGLTEPRDLKEVITLAEVLDHVNRREISRALDIIVQRIVAIQAARQKGGTWEKAENLELISGRC